MSTEATAVQKKLFNEASAAKLPKLICTGYVAKIGEGKPSKSGNYNVNPIEINGFGAARNATVYVLTRPEWFETDEAGNPTFRPDALSQVEGGSAMQFVYRRNIRGRGSVSILEGVCGSEERFEKLQEEFLTTDGIDDENDSAEVIERILQNNLLPKDGEQGFEIGYTLSQQRTKTDEKDENGKFIYLLDNRYEVSNFWEATEKAKESHRKSAEKSAKRAAENGKPVSVKVTFATGENTPF